MGVGLSIIYPVLLILMIYHLVKQDEVRRIIFRYKRDLILFFVVLLIFLTSFTYVHMKLEHTLYYWDFSGFWRKSIEFNRYLQTDIKNAMALLIDSILHNEYSYLPQLFLAPFTLILGSTYPRFILAMIEGFIVPSHLFYFLLGVIWMDRLNLNQLKYRITLGILLIFFTGNILPLFYGYIGSVGQVFIAYLLILITVKDMRQKQTLTLIVLALVLILLIMLRRWYAYFGLSLLSVYPLGLLFDNRKDLAAMKSIVVNFLVSGLVLGLILVTFLKPLTVTFLSYDYSFAYQSASVGGLEYALPWFINFYSPIWFGLMLAGSILGVSNPKTRLMVMVSLGSILLTIVLFYRIQVFGTHHYYIINGWALILIMLGILHFLSLLKSRTWSILISTLLVFLVTTNFAALYIDHETAWFRSLYTWFKPLYTSLYAPPRQREDVDTIKDIASYLGEHAKAYEYVYVLAGSSSFNDDLLRNAWLPEILNPIPTIESTHHLDTRDGIPYDFFNYTYVVVANPIQYHNGASYQKVIGILADGMLNDTKLQDYYFLEKTYEIEQGIQVFIYRRIEDIPDSIREKYRELFKTIYPSYPFLYQFR